MTRIRLGLESGRSRDQVVAELVQGGLSKPSAERFVDRALAEKAPAPVPPAGRPPHAEAAEDRGGRRAMISGAFWLSLGGCVTGVTYLLAKPGGKYVVAYGAVIAGALAFARGLARWSHSPTGPFPWRPVLVALSLPVMGTGALVGGSVGAEVWKRRAQAAEEERLEREERARAEDEAAAEKREAADRARDEAQAERIRKAWDTVRTSTRPDPLCTAALLLGRNGASEAVPDLEVLLHNPQFSNVQGCAASALVLLGETDKALDAYAEWAGGSDTDLRRVAYMGFGEVGPEAAPLALPHLAEGLRSPHWDMRYLVVRTLAELGPSARPLLEEARSDSQKEVREFAARALAQGE